MSLSSATAAMAEKSHNKEVKFLLEEIFFSRTDDRGVILNGNQVFHRVSGYERSELIGAPHKLIRHPDMPKGVFWLFWDRLKAGAPIGAYVKNKSKGGGYYWVFAIASPLDDGFISVRLKPTSPILRRIKELYSEIRQMERTTKCTAQESAEVLLQRLWENGFSDYPMFMAHAIAEELTVRSTVLGRAPDKNLANYAEMRKSLENITNLGNDILKGFGRIRTSPLNMRIKSRRMGDIAAPLTAVLTNFDALTENIRDSIESFLCSSETALINVNDGLFVNCSNEIQRETINRFRPDDDPEDQEATLLEAEKHNQLNVQYDKRIRVALHNIQLETKKFFDMAVLLKRTLSGLSVTRILCQIETARLDDSTGGINEVIAQLREFQEITSNCLSQIEDESDRIKSNVEKISLNIKSQPNELPPLVFPRPPITVERRSVPRTAENRH
ncbi:MAG: PAS domain-containing protein [Sulfitobacter sp.]